MAVHLTWLELSFAVLDMCQETHVTDFALFSWFIACAACWLAAQVC